MDGNGCAMTVFTLYKGQHSTAFSMPRTLPGSLCLDHSRHQHSGSLPGGGAKVQFPTVPKEWQGRYMKGRMYKYQDTLPKLPVPSLQQTLKKYLIGVRVGCRVRVGLTCALCTPICSCCLSYSQAASDC